MFQWGLSFWTIWRFWWGLFRRRAGRSRGRCSVRNVRRVRPGLRFAAVALVGLVGPLLSETRSIRLLDGALPWTRWRRSCNSVSEWHESPETVPPGQTGWPPGPDSNPTPPAVPGAEQTGRSRGAEPEWSNHRQPARPGDWPHPPRWHSQTRPSTLHGLTARHRPRPGRDPWHWPCGYPKSLPSCQAAGPNFRGNLSWVHRFQEQG